MRREGKRGEESEKKRTKEPHVHLFVRKIRSELVFHDVTDKQEGVEKS